MRKRTATALVLLLLTFAPAASADSGYLGSGHLTSWIERVVGFLGWVCEADSQPQPPRPAPEGHRLSIPGGSPVGRGSSDDADLQIPSPAGRLHLPGG